MLAIIYQRLYEFFGPQHWWPGDSPLEIMVGALLTQNTNWNNVSRAIDTLKRDNLLSFEALECLPLAVLAEKIRPSGYYNQKAQRLKGLLAAIRQQAGDLEAFLAMDTETLRRQLLAIRGIGPETADSILLYAANRPVFVVDAYSHRILHRHGLAPEECDYHELQELFTAALEPDPALFNEYHALLVRTGKEFCRKRAPACDRCPLGPAPDYL